MDQSDREPTHNEFTTDAFVSIPFDNNDKSWSISITLPKEVVAQFRAQKQPLQFHMCSTGSGPTGQPNERHYVSLLRSDWNQRTSNPTPRAGRSEVIRCNV